MSYNNYNDAPKDWVTRENERLVYDTHWNHPHVDYYDDEEE